MLAVAYPVNDNAINHVSNDKLLNMIIIQKESYKKIHDECYDLLTPREKEFFKYALELKNSYISNISQVDNGKYITFFLPEFSIKEYERTWSYYRTELTWKKHDGTTFTKEYSSLPRICEIPYPDECKVSELIGKTNGFGWVIIRARNIEHKKVFKEILY